MLICISFIYLDEKFKGNPTQKKEVKAVSVKHAIITVILLFLIVITNAAFPILNKIFVLSDGVTDEKSYLFFANLFMLIGGGVAILFSYIRKREDAVATVGILKTAPAIAMFGNAALTCVQCLVGVLIMASLDVTIATPLSSAVGIVMSVVTSIILRERLGIFSYLATALTILVFVI
jgi:hypothetical protein